MRRAPVAGCNRDDSDEWGRDVVERHQARGIAHLLEQVGRALGALCLAHDLHPVQWSALRYFARAGKQARTVSGLATYQGTTLAPASRTIASLVRRGYLMAETDPGDRRRRTHDLTDHGRDVLSEDPIIVVEDSLSRLTVNERDVMTRGLEAVLGALLTRPELGQSAEVMAIASDD